MGDIMNKRVYGRYLLVFLLVIGGCGEKNTAENRAEYDTEYQAEYQVSERPVTANQDQTAAKIAALLAEQTLELAEGEVRELELSPELREQFFTLGRVGQWYNLPEFVEGALPTDPTEYWFWFLYTSFWEGYDRDGWGFGHKPWRVQEADIAEPMHWGIMQQIPRADYEGYIARHFGPVALAPLPEDYVGKYFCYDGEYYYDNTYEDGYRDWWGVLSLSGERRGERIIYTLEAVAYGFDDWNLYNEGWGTVDEYLAGRSEPPRQEEMAVLQAYYDQLNRGELSMDQAIQQMIVNGRVADWPELQRLKIRMYYDGEAIVYLACERQDMRN